MELADQQVADNEVAAEIPVDAAEPAERSEKLTLRDQISKSVESVRTEEAKRARAADGKFTRLEAGADKPATPEPDPKPEANAQPEASKPVGPPSGWSKDAKAVWDQLPEAVKADAVRREAEVSKGFDEYRTKTAQFQEITQALDPIRPMLQQQGIQSDAQAVKRLLEWEGSFRNPQTRAQAFQNLAQTYGIDLSTLVPSSQPGTPSTAQDIPEPLRPVIDQFGNIAQQVQSVEARLQTWEQAQVAEKLTSFASTHPHFDAVRVQMGQLMTAGIVPPGDLESAYQKAIAIDPVISGQIRAEEDKRRADELAKANAEKLKRASAAAVSPSTRPPTGTPGGNSASKKASVRDSILSSVQTLWEEQRA